MKSYLPYKRLFDLIFAAVGLVLVSPLLLIAAILIKLTSQGPIFFKQIRIGMGQKEFKIFKFRTMYINAETQGTQITIGRDPRITSIGHYLRTYKLDELPQLFNVLRGEMSLVGPRPEVPRYVKFYQEEQKKVFRVRPGITDYASIKYFDENRLLGEVKDPEDFYIHKIMPDKLDLNLQYIREMSLKKDMQIILFTVIRIF
ncbi:sugar transferase [Paenibacillus koleovorans]|uniref:sugar transferase n=1 Tax=Paenibacillus koleovorans TaxID=121608 RepID=UPI000FD9E4FA|nr:sugar transferase [Paenibacillus koleovorans]